MFNSPPRKRTWGFRLTPQDILSISAFTASAVILRRLENPLWWMLVIVASHFFLFCNVFRIIRHLELIWSGLFILNVGVWFWADNLSFTRILLSQLPITIVVLWVGIKSSNYHGIFANRLNPLLKDYLEERL